jgi:thiol peroxidase
MGRTVTLKGNAQNVEGPELKAGQPAPDFKLQGIDMSDLTSASLAGKVHIIATVPSLDTPVCDKETRYFNESASKIPGVEIITVSVDTPMAQKRWCGAAGINNLKTASDHRTAEFGKAYGVLLKGGPLDRFLARAVFVVDKQNKLAHVEYVPEIAQEPNYEAALAAAKKAAS